MTGLEAAAERLAGRSVLIVGMNYAPEHTGIARYATATAEILAEYAAHVEVVAGVPHYPAWRVEPEYRWTLRSRDQRNGVHVRRFRHYVPGRQSAARRAAWEGTFLANGLLAAPSRRPDIVLATTPCLAAGVLGARFAARARAPYGVVVQDLVGQAARQSGISGGGAAARVASRVERWILQRAHEVAIVSDGFRAQLRDYAVDETRIRRLPNWTHIGTPQGSTDSAREKLGWPREAFVVLHTGNMGLKQDLGNVIEAARLLAERRDVLFVLLGDGNQRRALEELAIGVANLRIADPVDDTMYPAVLRAADLLLVNELPTVGEMSLPSKLTSYFMAGRPVLAAVDAAGACAREINKTRGAGIVVPPGDPATLADAVLRAASTSSEIRDAMGAAGLEYARAELGLGAARRRIVTLAADLLATAPGPRATERVR